MPESRRLPRDSSPFPASAPRVYPDSARHASQPQRTASSSHATPACALFTRLPIAASLTHAHGQRINAGDKSLRFIDAFPYPVPTYHDDAFDQRAHPVTQQNPVYGEMHIRLQTGAVYKNASSIQFVFQTNLQSSLLICKWLFQRGKHELHLRGAQPLSIVMQAAFPRHLHSWKLRQCTKPTRESTLC